MICKNCNRKESIKYSKYSSGEFCSKECSKSYSTKFKRDLISKKVSEKLKGHKHSDESKKLISINNSSHRIENKEKIKNSLLEYYKTEKGKIAKEKMSKLSSERIMSEETRKKIGLNSKKRCEDLEVRRFMGKIGMNGSSWGNTGYTQSGRFYQSNFEKKCFELLDLNEIDFNEHKYLPDSSRISDIYIEKMDLWIELDGVGRERRKDFLFKKYGKDVGDYWQFKIDEYENNNLNYKIFLNFNEFKQFVNSI